VLRGLEIGIRVDRAAVVTDPPYGLEFMGRAWDGADGFRRSLNAADVGRDDVFGRTSRTSPEYRTSPMRRRPEHDAVNTGMSRQGGRQWRGEDGQKRQARDARTYQEWSQRWAEAALRVAKPSAYLLAFGGTRTVHRMTCAIEDAGWIIRDQLCWIYASGFPKSRASLKPAYEPIILARKPGPLRDLNIDRCRIPMTDADREDTDARQYWGKTKPELGAATFEMDRPVEIVSHPAGRWPSNVLLSPTGDGLPNIFDGRIEGVVGGADDAGAHGGRGEYSQHSWMGSWSGHGSSPQDIERDSGTYSRFFLVPKSSRSDREPVLGGLPETLTVQTVALGDMEYATYPDGTRREARPKARANVHPTVKPTDLMRHLVRLVTPTGGVVLDPFGGSGSTALACELEGFPWVLIEREAEYVAIAEARLNGVQRGLGLPA